MKKKLISGSSRWTISITDDLAYKAGHVVARLSPYHCNFILVKLVWSQVKGYIARHNKTFKLCDVFDTVASVLSQIMSRRWQAAVDHVIKEEGMMCELDGQSTC
jgi:hypothetical protein